MDRSERRWRCLVMWVLLPLFLCGMAVLWLMNDAGVGAVLTMAQVRGSTASR